MRRFEAAIVLAILFATPSALAKDRCLGLFIGDRPIAAEIENRAKLYETKPCIILIFSDAKHPVSGYDLSQITSASARPMITVEPWDAQTKEFLDISDEYISSLASAIESVTGQVYIRYAHEMNSNWYPWAGNPKRYLEDYKNFHDRLNAALPKSNIQWVFSVNNENVPNSNRNSAINYYPGDEYVDFIGIDGYFKAPSRSYKFYHKVAKFLLRQNLFEYLFASQMESLKILGKPFLITETAIAAKPDFKSESIKDFFESIDPSISAIIWFDIDKEADWRAASDIESLESFKKWTRWWISHEKK
jgi:beta-mannanase